MKLAYLTNQYPAPSHSFIRREILAHEAAGRQVLRYTIRRYAGALADPQDQAEQTRTRCVLDAGSLRLGMALARVAARRFNRLAAALRAAWVMGRTSDRGRLVHLAYLAEACLLLQWLEAEGVGHLHVHFGTNPAAVAMLCRILGGPTYSFTVHGPDEFDVPVGLALEEKTRHAAFTVGISSYGKSQLCRWISPDDQEKLQVVHCGLDPVFLETQPMAVPDVRRLIFVGRLTTTKGVFILVEALRLLQRRGVPFELTMVGDGPERASIEDRIARHGLQTAIHLVGFKSSQEVRQEILGSRALVLPSFAEGLPVVLMEALALARPVVTTWVAGIPELVEQGANGWLVPPGSVEALAEALTQVLNAPVEKLTAMGLYGRETVLREHDAATEAAKLAKLFEQTAGV